MPVFMKCLWNTNAQTKRARHYPQNHHHVCVWFSQTAVLEFRESYELMGLIICKEKKNNGHANLARPRLNQTRMLCFFCHVSVIAPPEKFFFPRRLHM
jgi:hypothetical protein